MLRLLAPLAVVLPLLLSVPAHAATTTTFVGYVTAGDRVSGATVTSLGVHARTDANGYFVLRVPGKPALVRVTAAGGTVDGSALEGSLAAVVSQPGPARNAYLNPLTTIVAAYLDRHPQTSLTTATAKVRGMFTIPSVIDLGHDLMHSRAYLDGSLFLRVASHHGGLDRYVGTVVRRIESGGVPMRFGSAMPGGKFGDAVKLAANLVSIYSGVNDLLHPDISNRAELEALLSALGDVQGELSGMAGDLRSIWDLLLSSAYADSVRPVHDLEGKIRDANVLLEDVVTNALSPNASATVADDLVQSLESDIDSIRSHFSDIDDVLRGALVSGGGILSSYHLLGVVLRNDGFMSPADSTQLSEFAQEVLDYQALGFNLVVAWARDHNAKATETLYAGEYLGSGVDPATWAEGCSADSGACAPPPSGALHDEQAMVGSIQAVPADTMVDGNGGTMWQTGHWGGPGATFNAWWDSLFADTASPDCTVDPADPDIQDPNGGWSWQACHMVSVLKASLDQLASDLGAEMTRHTSLAGWRPATKSEVKTFLGRYSDAVYFPYDYIFLPPDQLVSGLTVDRVSQAVSGFYFAYVDRDDGWNMCAIVQPTSDNPAGLDECTGGATMYLRQTTAQETYWP